MTLGPRLRRLRQERGLSQRTLGKLAGVRQALISKLETGRQQDTTGGNLTKLADFFGLTVDAFLHGEDFEDHPYDTPRKPALWWYAASEGLCAR